MILPSIFFKLTYTYEFDIVMIHFSEADLENSIKE